MKTLALLIILFMAVQAIAQTPTKFQTDVLQFGRGTSLLPKELIFDAGDGASNKKFSLDPSDNQLDLNTTLNITGNATVTGNLLAPTGQVNSSTLSVETTSTLKGDVTLGNGTNSQRTIQVNRAGFDPFLRWKESLGKWVFSNDGTIEKPFGSGSGSGDGGINLLENPSFEDGVSVDWTSTCSSFTGIPYTNPKPNDSVFARCVASASGQFFESVAKLVPDDLGVGCLAYARYNTTSNNAFKISFFSAGVEINSRVLPTTNGAWQTTPYVPVMCPAAGTSIKVRIESLSAATIDADRAYLGNENRTVQASSPRLVARVQYNAAASCLQQRVSTSFGAFPTSATCGAPTITYFNQGGVTVATTDQDSFTKFTISSLPKGILEVRGRGTGDSGTGNDYYYLRFNDGSTTGEEQAYYSNPNGAWVWQTVGFKKAYPNGATNLTIELEGRANTSSITIVGTIQGAQYDLYLWPLDTDTAVTSEASGWFIDANIGGANPSYGTSSVTSYTEVTNASLDMVLNSGSAPARIPCSGTNPATGLTCSAGSESVGVNFTNLTTGYFDVCAEFTNFQNIAASSSVNTANQIVLTANSSQTILQEGKSRTNTGLSAASGGPETNLIPVSTCGTFLFSDSSEKTVRLMFEQSASGTIVSSQIQADRLATEGQRDIRITVRPSTMNIARPVLTGEQVTMKGATNAQVCRVWVTGPSGTIGSPTLMSSNPLVELFDNCNMQNGTLNRGGVGDYVMTVTGWKPFTPIDCTVEANGGTFGALTNFTYTDGSGSTAVNFRTRSGAALADATGAMIKCTGDRQ